MRTAELAAVLCCSLCAWLYMENRLLRRDLHDKQRAIADFIAKKTGGKALADVVVENKLAVFPDGQDWAIVCGRARLRSR